MRIASILWKLLSTVGDSFSNVGDSFSTVEDSFSAVEVVQYIGGIISVHVGDTFSTVGIPSVQWGYLKYSGG